MAEQEKENMLLYSQALENQGFGLKPYDMKRRESNAILNELDRVRIELDEAKRAESSWRERALKAEDLQKEQKNILEKISRSLDLNENVSTIKSKSGISSSSMSFSLDWYHILRVAESLTEMMNRLKNENQMIEKQSKKKDETITKLRQIIEDSEAKREQLAKSVQIYPERLAKCTQMEKYLSDKIPGVIPKDGYKIHLSHHQMCEYLQTCLDISDFNSWLPRYHEVVRSLVDYCKMSYSNEEIQKKGITEALQKARTAQKHISENLDVKIIDLEYRVEELENENDDLRKRLAISKNEIEEKEEMIKSMSIISKHSSESNTILSTPQASKSLPRSYVNQSNLSPGSPSASTVTTSTMIHYAVDPGMQQIASLSLKEAGDLVVKQTEKLEALTMKLQIIQQVNDSLQKRINEYQDERVKIVDAAVDVIVKVDTEYSSRCQSVRDVMRTFHHIPDSKFGITSGKVGIQRLSILLNGVLRGCCSKHDQIT